MSDETKCYCGKSVRERMTFSPSQMSGQTWLVEHGEHHCIADVVDSRQAEYLRRAQAAFTAVEGIPTEALESGALGKALESLEIAAGHFTRLEDLGALDRSDEPKVLAMRDALRSLGRLK